MIKPNKVIKKGHRGSGQEEYSKQKSSPLLGLKKISDLRHFCIGFSDQKAAAIFLYHGSVEFMLNIPKVKEVYPK